MSEPTRDADAECAMLLRSMAVLIRKGHSLSSASANKLDEAADRLEQPSMPAEVVEGLYRGCQVGRCFVNDEVEKDFGILGDVSEGNAQALYRLDSALTAYEQWKAKHGT